MRREEAGRRLRAAGRARAEVVWGGARGPGVVWGGGGGGVRRGGGGGGGLGAVVGAGGGARAGEPRGGGGPGPPPRRSHDASRSALRARWGPPISGDPP